jgi:hypothetical protein
MLNKTLLGSAAVIMTMVGAQAADLPSKKAAPATYVKICDAYGAGFYTIPGTDTCVKVGGFVRVDYDYRPERKNTVFVPAVSAVTGVQGVSVAVAAGAVSGSAVTAAVGSTTLPVGSVWTTVPVVAVSAAGAYTTYVSYLAAGSALITLRNLTAATSYSEAVIINFSIIHGAA